MVRPDGKITVRLAGELQARGLTPAQLAKNLDAAYSHELNNPVATVHVKSTPSRQVYVDGEVTHPGAFTLAPDMSPLQAVAMAGGLTTEASAASALLIRHDACGNPAAIRLDIDRARRSDEPGDLAMLMPGDLVYVPPSGIANLDLFVKHYIKNLLPVNPYLMMP
jgi:protein involved in polysaccharide export with SLBB domain